MNNNQNFAIEIVTANSSGIMEADTILINERSLKRQTSKRNFLNRNVYLFYLFILVCMFTVNNVNAQKFNCQKDRLHAGSIQISPDPSSLILGQSCEVSVFNSKGKRVNSKFYRITSENRNVRSSGSSFSIDNNPNTRGESWSHVDGKLIEIDGDITISIIDCHQKYSFPFQIRQQYEFDRSLSCKGERREFAIAPYKNVINKNLYVVLDISRNQIYLLEAPISIDASGVRGTPGIAGISGTNGKTGAAGTEKNYNGGRGTDGTNGGDGGDGGNGGNGGEIIVYMPRNTPSVVSINVEGGAGGYGGAAGKGGKGGSGGNGYEIKVDTGEKNKQGKPKYRYDKIGEDGPDGKDGIAGKPGKDGMPGQRGNYSISVDNDIKKYFENLHHSYFDINNIVE